MHYSIVSYLFICLEAWMLIRFFLYTVIVLIAAEILVAAINIVVDLYAGVD